APRPAGADGLCPPDALPISVPGVPRSRWEASEVGTEVPTLVYSIVVSWFVPHERRATIRKYSVPVDTAGSCTVSLLVRRSTIPQDRKSTRVNSSHVNSSYAV